MTAHCTEKAKFNAVVTGPQEACVRLFTEKAEVISAVRRSVTVAGQSRKEA